MAPRGKSPGKAATVVDIARELGISPMTVSRVVSGHQQVSDDTRRRVLAKVKELNYRPNRSARSMVTGRSNMIGLVIPDISHSFYAEITRGIQDVIEQHGFNLLLCNTNRDPETELREIEALLSARVDGLIIASERPEPSWKSYAQLKQQGVRFVLIDRFFEKLACPVFATDDFEAGRLATAHLLQLGHRRIAHIQGPPISAARLRLDGYLRALKSAGIKANEEWIVPGNFRLAESREAARFLLCLRNRPTAIVAANDNSAFGAIRACREAGLTVPENISVAGIGNVEGEQHPNPFLTTIHWDRLELGRAAGRALLAGIQSNLPMEAGRTVFPPSLLIRQSSGPPPASVLTSSRRS